MPDLLTVLTLIATGGIVVIFVAIAINPNLSINPYPPTTPEPSSTMAATRAATARPPTSAPSSTPTPPVSPSPTRIRPATLTPSPTPEMPFVASAAPVAAPDCSIVGVAGTVSDVDGEPLTGYPVHVWWSEGERVVLSGSAPTYGDSGWEVTIPNPQELLTDTWYVQLHLLNTFRTYPAVSSIIPVRLSENCEENLILIRFQEREE